MGAQHRTAPSRSFIEMPRRVRNGRSPLHPLTPRASSAPLCPRGNLQGPQRPAPPQRARPLFRRIEAPPAPPSRARAPKPGGARPAAPGRRPAAQQLRFLAITGTQAPRGAAGGRFRTFPWTADSGARPCLGRRASTALYDGLMALGRALPFHFQLPQTSRLRAPAAAHAPASGAAGRACRGAVAQQTCATALGPSTRARTRRRAPGAASGARPRAAAAAGPPAPHARARARRTETQTPEQRLKPLHRSSACTARKARLPAVRRRAPRAARPHRAAPPAPPRASPLPRPGPCSPAARSLPRGCSFFSYGMHDGGHSMEHGKGAPAPEGARNL